MQATLPPGDRTTDLSATDLSISVEDLGRTLEAFFRQRQLPLAVRCALQGDRLLVVGNHRTDTALNPREVLQLLEARIHALQIRSIQQVGLYLRIVGQPQPYMRRQFLLNQAPPKPVLAGMVAGVGAIAPPVAIPIPRVPAAAPVARPVARPPAGVQPPRQPSAPKAPQTFKPQASKPQASKPQASKPQASKPQASKPQAAKTATLAESGSDHRLLLAGIGAVGLALGSYVLTQPCTIGGCPQLQTAESLGTKSFTVVTQAPASPDLAAAQQYLTGAIDLLETVPIWSRHRAASGKLLQQYQQESHTLAGLVSAERAAAQAMLAGQTQVRNAQSWQLIQSQWEKAIAQLESVPASSPFYAPAAAKLQDYRGQLEQVQERVRQEEMAAQLLTEAKQLLNLAWARQKKAAAIQRPDLADAVMATWQAGIDRLQRVPSDTSAGFEAERLLAIYQPRVAQVKTDLAAAIARAAAQPPAPQTAPAPPDAQPVQAIAPQQVSQQVPQQALTPQQMAQYQQQMLQQQTLQQQMLQQQRVQQMQGQQMQGQPLPPPSQMAGQ